MIRACGGMNRPGFIQPRTQRNDFDRHVGPLSPGTTLNGRQFSVAFPQKKKTPRSVSEIRKHKFLDSAAMPRCRGSQRGTRQMDCRGGVADESGTCHNRPQPISCISCTDCFRPSGSGRSPVWHAPRSTLWLSRPAEIAPMIRLLSSSTR